MPTGFRGLAEAGKMEKTILQVGSEQEKGTRVWGELSIDRLS
jgi:hypothetical protein